MKDEQLQRIAYLYGRSSEKLKEYHNDIEAYNSYVTLSMTLWRTLKSNDAIHDNGRLKSQYIHAMEAGRNSVLR